MSQQFLHKQVKNYILKEIIGRGSFALVYNGKDVTNDRLIAVKEIQKSSHNPNEENGAKILRYFQQEIQILRSMDHPNIIRLLDVVDTSEFVYLIFEYCEMGDLQKYIQKQPNGRLQESQAKPIIKQIINAMEYLYKNNIVHRDLKLANILMNSDNQIKLADFGFAILKDECELLASYCGSPYIMAPEMLSRQKAGYDEKCDVWSLGVITYQLLYGNFPYKVNSQYAKDLLNKILTTPVEYPQHIQVSEELLSLIKRMLVVNPLERISYIEIINNEWVYENQKNDEDEKYDLLINELVVMCNQTYIKLNDFKQQLQLVQMQIKNSEVSQTLDQFLKLLSSQVIEIQIQSSKETSMLYFVRGLVKLNKTQFELTEYYLQTYNFCLLIYSQFLEFYNLEGNQDIIKALKLLSDHVNNEFKFSNSIIIETSEEFQDQIFDHLQDNFQNRIYREIMNPTQRELLQKNQQIIKSKWSLSQSQYPDDELTIFQEMLEKRIEQFKNQR